MASIPAYSDGMTRLQFVHHGGEILHEWPPLVRFIVLDCLGSQDVEVTVEDGGTFVRQRWLA